METSKLRRPSSVLGRCTAEKDCNETLSFEIYIASLADNIHDMFTSFQWRIQDFFGGDSTNSVEDRGQRERGSAGGRSLIRGSGGNCNLVQEISYAAYTLYLYSCSQHGSIFSGLYSCSLGYFREFFFLLLLHWLPLNLVILLRMYFQRNWEFGSAFSKLRNFGGGGGG
jgi:hypothetical protein